MGKRLGILGGTFDPPHLGHLIIAAEALDLLPLDRVLFVPAATPPHKIGRVDTSAKRRLEMVEMAVSGNQRFDFSSIECDREGVSYTVDTLRELKERYPDDELFLLMGADTLHDFRNWKDPSVIADLANIVVLARPDCPPFEAATLTPPLRVEQAADIARRVLPTPLLEISSRSIRQRVVVGRSIRYLTPPAVEAYIRANKLYVAGDGEPA